MTSAQTKSLDTTMDDSDAVLADAAAMAKKARAAAAYLKALSHEGRLAILCHLGDGERTVTELTTLLRARQSAVSQQLARLRAEGLVVGRRDGKTIRYSIADESVHTIIGALSRLFCT